MTSDVNKLRGEMQSLRQSNVLLTFLCEFEYVINRLSQGVFVIALSINP